ncbi:MAG: hypothetical protein SH850_10600 [Planctomycetaceae bacterium]|nr:hypothetical protein [Planctomycetaceae bacterium]
MDNTVSPGRLRRGVTERTLGIPLKMLEVGGHMTACIVRPHRFAAVCASEVDVGAALIASHLKSMTDRHNLAVERASNCKWHCCIPDTHELAAG